MRQLPGTIGVMALAALASCDTGTVPSGAPEDGMAPAAIAPFEMPMDPGSIACSAIAANPAALGAATEWTLGRLRAQVMSGARAAVPDQGAVSAALAGACAANPGARLSQVAGGLAL